MCSTGGRSSLVADLTLTRGERFADRGGWLIYFLTKRYLPQQHTFRTVLKTSHAMNKPMEKCANLTCLVAAVGANGLLKVREGLRDPGTLHEDMEYRLCTLLEVCGIDAFEWTPKHFLAPAWVLAHFTKTGNYGLSAVPRKRNVSASQLAACAQQRRCQNFSIASMHHEADMMCKHTALLTMDCASLLVCLCIVGTVWTVLVPSKVLPKATPVSIVAHWLRGPHYQGCWVQRGCAWPATAHAPFGPAAAGVLLEGM